jgi:cytochrome c biogenesis protein CcdA
VPVTITASLAISIIVFTLLLKASTALLGVPQQVWSLISGGIIIALGVSFVIPSIWEHIVLLTKFNTLASGTFASGMQKKGLLRDISMGAALGPVFSSCSPTYALIVALVLPVSFAKGFVYLVGYVLGLATVLFALALMGSVLVKRLGWLTNPHGCFKRVVGIIFIVVGVAVLFGIDKEIQAFVLDAGWYAPIERFEQRLGF